MLLKRTTVLVAGATLPLATAIALAPAATAQESPTVTETIDVTYNCTSSGSSSADLNIGGASPWTNQVEVTYPENVSPGEYFDVSLQPGQMQPNTNRLGRLTYDIQMPGNANNISHTLASPAAGFSGGNAAVVTVNPTTKVNASGTDVLRIWGGASATHGSSSGSNVTQGFQKNSAAANPVRLPGVTFSMRAPNTPGEEIAFGLPGAGAASAADAATTQFQYTRGANATGTTGVQVMCAVSANAAELTSTTITDAPWVPFEWNTPLNVQAQPGELDEDSLAVNVVTSFQRPTSDLPEGTKVRILRDGIEIGEVEIPTTGTSVSFADEISRTADDRVYRYTAEIIDVTDSTGDTWTGSSETPAPVIVTGTGAAPGGGGSLDSGSLSPGSLINPIDSAIAGSLTSSLSDSAGYDVAPLSSPTVFGLLSSAI